MTTNLERATVLERALRAVVAGDRDELADVCTADVRVWTPEVVADDLTELLDALGARDEAFSDIDARIVPLDVGQDFACAEWTVELTLREPIELADGTVADAVGHRIQLHGVAVAEFTAGEICALRQYWDRQGLLEQLAASSGGT